MVLLKTSLTMYWCVCWPAVISSLIPNFMLSQRIFTMCFIPKSKDSNGRNAVACNMHAYKRSQSCSMSSSYRTNQADIRIVQAAQAQQGRILITCDASFSVALLATLMVCCQDYGARSAVNELTGILGQLDFHTTVYSRWVSTYLPCACVHRGSLS